MPNDEYCVLWYSEKQRKVCARIDGGAGYIIGILGDGSEVHYTEMKCGEHRDEIPNWSDAVRLGEGQFLRKADV